MKALKDPFIRAGLVGAIIGTAGVVGCTDAPHPTEATSAAAATVPRVATWLNSPDLPTVQSALDDASGRLTRSIQEEQSRTRLAGYVDSLSHSIEIGDADGAERNLALARAELDGAAGDAMASHDKELFESALDRAVDLIAPTK